MDTQTQLDVVAYLHIAYGVLMLLIAFVVIFFLELGGALSADPGAAAALSGVSVIVGVVLAVVAAPSIIGGIGLLNRRDWSRILLLVLGALALFSFPIGTAVGGYTIYVLVQQESRDALVG